MKLGNELRDRLMTLGRVTEENLRLAESHAAATGVSVEVALVELGAASREDIGKCLAIVNRLPYVRLTGRPTIPGARGAFGVECARHWQAFPVDYDPYRSLLTLAVHDSECASELGRVFTFLMEPYDLHFCVAPEVELDEAVRKYAMPAGEPVADDRAVDSFAAGAAGESGKGPVRERTPLYALRDRVAQDRKAGVVSGGVPRLESTTLVGRENDEFSRWLISAVSLFVVAHLGEGSKAALDVGGRARYAQLVAGRLVLGAAETTRAILTAWFSGLANEPDLVRRFLNPFGVEPVVLGGGQDRRGDMAGLILDMIVCYQDIIAGLGEEARDIHLIRRGLYSRCSTVSGQDGMIETFLQVLMDEQFLDKLGNAAGTVLVFDPAKTMAPQIEAGLARAGYRVRVLSALDAVRQSMNDELPSVVLVDAGGASADLLEFCRQAKEGPVSVPVLALVPASAGVRAAELLRAGAEDVLSMPIDPEILALKVEKAAGSRARPGAQDGVTGSLSDMGFVEMVQVLSAGMKNAEIRVRHGEERGLVVLREGNVIHAEAGEVTGERAFYALMNWSAGEFSMRECGVFPTQTVSSSTVSLLMEGARLHDEGTGAGGG